MEDDTYVGEDPRAGAAASSRELVVYRIQTASAFVTPFADAVAAELESFGLVKTKIDEILLKAAHRFGAQSRASFDADAESAGSKDSPKEGYFDWMARWATQTFENAKSAIYENAPRVWEHLSALFQEALHDAFDAVIREAMKGKGRKRRLAT